ncbi:MAG: type II toxin-antitoxin system Phd/YefM family antitoxin [Alphaproteobacteria bacterium]|nr:MAG: type II toxin-antitoxin system Phd/YefM family antitoxin [Alphaproteobacteria bacterium]
MKYSERIRSISYLKSHAAEVIRDLGERREPMIITQNGEARMVIQDVQSYERTQETLALLKILALGNQQIDAGRTHTARQAFQRVRAGRTAR